MSKRFRQFLPLMVLLVFVLVAVVIFLNPPKPKRGKPSIAIMGVDVSTLRLSDVNIMIDSYGTIKPRTQSVLLPQVSGQIMSISPSFREGGFFEKGEVLVELDKRDLQAEVKIAQSSLLTAKQLFSEENARAKQAATNWKRLGNKKRAPDLVLRKPQLQAAQAQVLSAEANLDKAKLALERSSIVAPYTGRILSKAVDVGQVVSSNTELAKIYAVDYVEIRLPIKNKDLPYVKLPEASRHEREKRSDQPTVTIYSDLILRQSWQGKVVRTEGAFDTASQQLFVVAQIDDPYGTNNNQELPLKIGQYVSAKVQGVVLEGVLAIPNKAIYQNSYVYIVNNEKLERKQIKIQWQNEIFSVIKSGLKSGQLLVVTPLGQVSSGTGARLLSIDGKAINGESKNEKKPLLEKQRLHDDSNQMKDKPAHGDAL